MIRKFAVFLLLLGLAGIFVHLLQGYTPATELNQTARYYAEHAEPDLGAANIVTAIVVTWRGLDTLGEVTVLFLASAIIGIVLAHGEKQQRSLQRKLPPSGELLTTGSRLLTPLILLFGAYVFVNGHLTPGGGFQGGAILASAALLLLLTDPLKRFSHMLISVIESISGLVFVGVGVLGLLLAADGFLDNRILPTGAFGTLFSAGAIPLIYSFVGLKVGAEFTSMLSNLAETEKS